MVATRKRASGANPLPPDDEPGIVFAPQSLQLLKHGVDQLANAVRPTLGVGVRHVAIEASIRHNTPELLDDAATIARRIIEVPNPYVNTGAMLMRHVLWSLHEEVGDGGATAAVIMQALVREAVRLSAAGWNVMTMRRGIEKGLARALDVLKAQARPVQSEADVTKLTMAVSGDPELATIMGEIYDTVGPDGHVVVEEAYVRGLTREYVEGMYWKAGWISSAMATNDTQTEAKLTDAAVLVVQGDINKADQLLPLLDGLVRRPNPALFIVAYDVSGPALHLLLNNLEKVRSAAVKAPGYGDNRVNILHDIAILTGTRVVLADMGERVEDTRAQHLGRARGVTVNADYFGLIGGGGDAKLIRQRIAELRTFLNESVGYEKEALDQVRERLAKLIGGVAVIHVGGPTEAESKARLARVERAANTVRQAIHSGLVPGGGMAYLRCARALSELALPEDEAVGVRALCRALEEPLRAIASNSGADEGPVVALAKEQPEGYGYNALTGVFEDLWAAGIVDPLRVVEAALCKAVSGALMTVTTDAVVHRRKPPQSTTP